MIRVSNVLIVTVLVLLALPALAGEPTCAPAKADRAGDAGGDDIEVRQVDTIYHLDLAAASNGDLYAVPMFDDELPHDYEFAVIRSTDGGTTWSTWATFDDPSWDSNYLRPAIHVAEGQVDRCFVAYVYREVDDYELRIAQAPLGGDTGVFTTTGVVDVAPPDWIVSVDLTSDAASFSTYYVYAVFVVDDGNGGDVHFMRSVDLGNSFEPHYTLASLVYDDRTYENPTVAYGYGGYVHVAWNLFSRTGEFDRALRYRRAASYANGGLAAWGPTLSPSSHANGYDEGEARLAASLNSNDVMLAYERRQDGASQFGPLGVRASTDQGDTFAPEILVGDGAARIGDLEHQNTTNRFVLGAREDGQAGYRWAPRTDPTAWSDFVALTDQPATVEPPRICLDPAHDGRVAAAWSDNGSLDGAVLRFDGEWRGDPGYPNVEAGFPVDLVADSASDPALVDLDGDGYLEIVFGDEAGRIQVYRHDGTVQPGWPVDTGGLLSSSPIAVGDLSGDGRLEVIAGGLEGEIFAYDPDGVPLAGWPHDLGLADPVWVMIGALGGPYPRAVVWACGHGVGFLDHHGESYPGSVPRLFGSRVAAGDPAVGDIDDDGRSEVVVALSDAVYAFPMDTAGLEMIAYFGADVSAAPTLGDVDLDGDLEITVPLENGVLHLLDHDGSEHPGSWPVTVSATEIRGTAIAQCLGPAEPEIAVTALGAQVDLLEGDGSSGAFWPVMAGDWEVRGGPIIGVIDASPDVIVAARRPQGWSWDNIGQVNPGWPRDLEGNCYRTPAYGDIDLDGRTEIVFLTIGKLEVFDVVTAPSGGNLLWAMAGHDPERSGCADCAVDVVAVEEAPGGVTRVSMAAPWPNPIAGQATFAYAVPVRAQVELSIYDLRGRRLAVVERVEQTAGRHTVAWHGRDTAGRAVASGQYVAALTVRGPGVHETVSRKITVLR